ncbi:M56 family metallopeptidase [Spongiimicrobium sp. 3-5]|uniref:M56 family metallopeptidase n=1 Tax=Spongiimicrobium sp. 3-5 TaxID=3332596 RepID=UPI00397ED6E2
MTVLYLFYKLFLEQGNRHHFKRYYLLGILVLSLAIPLITFTQHAPLSTADATEWIVPFTEGNNVIKEPNQPINVVSILWMLYGIGALSFGFRFAKNLYRISHRIKYNPKHKKRNITNVLLRETIVPHTFFNYVFLNKEKYETGQIPKEVLLHEATHAKQKHSIDVLIVECCLVLFWFNPLLYYIKHAIKLNHEFLADNAVINSGVPTSYYQHILLAFSSNVAVPQQIPISMANAINYSSIKKRFTVMKTKTSPRSFRIKIIFLAPLVAVLLYSFSSREIIYAELEEIQTTDFQNFQEGASPEMVAEYNQTVRRLLAQPEGEKNWKNKDLQRLEYIYGLMSYEQKKQAEPFPVIAPPVPPSPPPYPASVEVEATIQPDEVSGSEQLVKPDDITEFPPPPPPKSPLEFAKEMAKQDAIFYYNGNKITTRKAIALLKKSDDIGLIAEHSDGTKPVVRLSTDVILIED